MTPALRRAAAAGLACLLSASIAAPSPGLEARSRQAAIRPDVSDRLSSMQAELDQLTMVTGTFTAMWLGLHPQVAPHRASIWRLQRELGALSDEDPATQALSTRLSAQIDAERAALAPMWPSWLAAKAVLHRAHRVMKRSLRALEPVVRGVLGQENARTSEWWAYWSPMARPGSPIGVCPVAGPTSFVNSFGAPRPGGRFHEGQDLLTAKGIPVLAVAEGDVVERPNELGGNALILYPDAGGYMYYAHLDAYGRTGAVRSGDVIGYAGNSGNARGLIHHVHFEYHPPGQGPVDVYRDLRAVC